MTDKAQKAAEHKAPRLRRAVTSLSSADLDRLEAHRERCGPPGARPSIAALLRLAVARGLPLILADDLERPARESPGESEESSTAEESTAAEELGR